MLVSIVIHDHKYGSVLTTLDSAIRRHLVRIEESGPGRAGVDTGEFLKNALAWIERYLQRSSPLGGPNRIGGWI